MSSPAPRAGATLLSLVTAAAAAFAACDRPPRAPPSVEVWLAGDVHLGAAATPDAAASRLAPLAEHARGLGVINLEGPAATTPDDPPHLLSNHPRALTGLRTAGVVVAGIANNHAFDAPDARAGSGHAADVTKRTAEAVRAAAIVPAGLDAGDAVIERDGLRIVVAAHAIEDVTAAALHARLVESRARGDVLIASLHVVATPSYLPGPHLVAAVEAAVAAGAAVVAVHGSHAVARVERRGAAVIAWGLGNLLFSCDCTDESDALLLRVTLTPAGAGDARVVPITAGLRDDAARPAAEPALLFDLLATLRSSPLERHADHARF